MSPSDKNDRAAKSLPRIAVLIPAYNAEGTIEKALLSLAANQVPHDIVVVDDGSNMPLKDVISARDNMVVLRPEKNVGITRALNIGLRYIYDKGYEFVARLDADDAATPGRLAQQLAYMDAHTDVVLLGTWGRVVSEDGRPLFYLNHPTDHESILRHSWYNSAFIHPSMMLRTALLQQAGGYYEMYSHAAEDYELTRRLAKFGKLANLPEYMIDYTYSTCGISQKKRRYQLKSRLKIQWSYRDFANPHFYLGILKTLALWYLPIRFLTAVKSASPRYQASSA